MMIKTKKVLYDAILFDKKIMDTVLNHPIIRKHLTQQQYKLKDENHMTLNFYGGKIVDVPNFKENDEYIEVIGVANDEFLKKKELYLSRFKDDILISEFNFSKSFKICLI